MPIHLIILIICQLILKRYQFECTLLLSFGEFKRSSCWQKLSCSYVSIYNYQLDYLISLKNTFCSFTWTILFVSLVIGKRCYNFFFNQLRSNSTVKLWRQKELKKMYAYLDGGFFFSQSF